MSFILPGNKFTSYKLRSFFIPARPLAASDRDPKAAHVSRRRQHREPSQRNDGVLLDATPRGNSGLKGKQTLQQGVYDGRHSPRTHSIYPSDIPLASQTRGPVAVDDCNHGCWVQDGGFRGDRQLTVNRPHTLQGGATSSNSISRVIQRDRYRRSHRSTDHSTS